MLRTPVNVTTMGHLHRGFEEPKKGGEPYSFPLAVALGNQE